MMATFSACSRTASNWYEKAALSFSRVMLLSWASATSDSASARTSSCSRTTILGELGSLYLSWAIWSVIFCLPGDGMVRVSRMTSLLQEVVLTVTAGLDRRLDVADALHGDAVLVVAVDELVLELTDLVDENAELVGDVGDVVVAGLAPDGELLLVGHVRHARIATKNSEDSRQLPYARGRRAPWSASCSSPS